MTKKLLKKKQPKTPTQLRKIRSLIDGMDELGEMSKKAKLEYDNVRDAVCNELTDNFEDHFEEIHEGVRRKGDVIRVVKQVVQDSILEDLPAEVYNQVTKLVVDPVLLNAAIERGDIPIAVVKKHTVSKPNKPFAKIVRK